jgi:acyl-CoA synthetase (AMP-forming)/AMP-acid ligase II
MASIAAGTAAAAGLLYFADQRVLGISRDLRSHHDDKDFAKRMPEMINRLGVQSTHLYRMLELADPNNDALWYEGRSWNYRALKAKVDEVALGMHESLGIKDGDIVAVFMNNSPEMIVTVLALTRLGAAPALINNALRDDTLLHCVRLPDSSLILSTPDLAAHGASAARSLGGKIKTVSLNIGTFPTASVATQDGSIIDFPFPTPSISSPATAALPPVPPKTPASVAALIYTSGTTGKPKACSVKNGLIMAVSCPVSPDAANPKKYLRGLRIYSCMPLFHGTTFFGGFCYSLGNSGCFCLGRKFSARNYWKEVSESRATKILYVGELCRFLLATPPSNWDKKHSVMVAMGNGMQKDVWIEFQKRFDVKEVREFYRSTEGLVKFDNQHFRGRRGAGKVGYLGPLRKHFLDKNQYLVRFDYDTEQPIRDPKTGFCQVASKGEPGEAIARILNMATYTNYHNNTSATEQKLLRDVFEKGDVWQRSGDLLVQESDNWVKFVDRIGDTYRWMGENVSAGEIRGLISELPGVKDAVVVGKRLGKYDGQAGAAMIVLDPTEKGAVDEKSFMTNLWKNLRAKGVPRYAVPRLVMVRNELVDVGDTFKHAKMVVKNIAWGTSGGDATAKTRQYYLHMDGDKDPVFQPLDTAVWARIEEGKAKL